MSAWTTDGSTDRGTDGSTDGSTDGNTDRSTDGSTNGSTDNFPPSDFKVTRYVPLSVERLKAVVPRSLCHA